MVLLYFKMSDGSKRECDVRLVLTVAAISRHTLISWQPVLGRVLTGCVKGKHGLSGFGSFIKYYHVVIGDTLFEHRGCYKVSWI